jgi:hypothetical protein
MTAERNFPIIPEVSRSVQNEFRTLRNMLYDAQDALTAIKPQPGAAGATGAQGAPGTTTIIQSGSSATLATPQMANVTQILGILAQAQRSYIPAYTSLPSPQDPASQNGSLISVNGILYRFNGSPQPGQWLPQAAIASVIEDTYANFTLAKYPPSSEVVGTVFLDTTRDVIYIVQVVSGSNAWVYAAGAYIAATASRPTTGFNGASLGVNDTGLEFRDSTLTITEYWSGSAWVQTPAVPASATVLSSNSSHQIIAAALADTKIWIGQGTGLPAAETVSGDASLADTGALTLTTVNSTTGTFGDATHVAQFTTNAKGLTTFAQNVAITFPGTSGFSGTVALAKLTAVTGSNGSLTVVNGLITAYTPPT